MLKDRNSGNLKITWKNEDRLERLSLLLKKPEADTRVRTIIDHFLTTHLSDFTQTLEIALRRSITIDVSANSDRFRLQAKPLDLVSANPSCANICCRPYPDLAYGTALIVCLGGNAEINVSALKRAIIAFDEAYVYEIEPAEHTMPVHIAASKIASLDEFRRRKTSPQGKPNRATPSMRK